MPGVGTWSVMVTLRLSKQYLLFCVQSVSADRDQCVKGSRHVLLLMTRIRAKRVESTTRDSQVASAAARSKYVSFNQDEFD